MSIRARKTVKVYVIALLILAGPALLLDILVRKVQALPVAVSPGHTFVPDANGKIRVSGTNLNALGNPTVTVNGAISDVLADGTNANALPIVNLKQLIIGTNGGATFSRVLEVVGDARICNDPNNARLTIETLGAAGNAQIFLISSNERSGQIAFNRTQPLVQTRGLIRYFHLTDEMDFQTQGTNRIVINNVGNVGIGDTNPIDRLTIGGGNLNLGGNSITNVSTNSIFFTDGSRISIIDGVLVFVTASGVTNVAASTNSVQFAENIGLGTNVFAQQIGSNLQFKTLLPGPGIALNATPSNIAITALSTFVNSNVTTIIFHDSLTAPGTLISGNWNVFDWAVGDSSKSVIGNITIPSDASLTNDIQFFLRIKQNGIGTGPSNIVWTMDARYIANGELTTNAIDETFTVTQTLSTIGIHIQDQIEFTLNETLIQPDDMIQIEFKRLGADAGDTFDANIGTLRHAFLRYRRK